MSKDTSNSNDKPGTPASLLVSIVCAIIVFALAEIQNTFTLGESFAMRSVLIAYVGLGLALAFFWKRLERSPFLKIASGFYLFGLWTSLFMTTLSPVLLNGESPLVHGQIMQQVGFGFIAFSGFMLIVALLQNQKMVPSLLLSSLGAVGLIVSGGAGLFMKSSHGNEGLITAHGPKADSHGDEGSDEGEGEGEEISSKHGAMAAKAAHPSDAHHGEHGDESEIESEIKSKTDSHSGHGEEDSAHADVSHHGVKPAKAPVASLDHVIPSSHKAPVARASAHAAAPVSDDFRKCAASSGPKNISSAWPTMSDVFLEYKLTSLSITDKAKNLQFKVGKQNFMKIAGNRYELVEFYLQSAPGHTIDGRSSALEAHFVHKDKSNNLAVLGVMIEEGASNKSFGEMWEFVPKSLHNPATPKTKVFNIAGLIPSKPKVYRYRGPHFTPPCADNVLWSIASEKMTMSRAQIEAFRSRSNPTLKPAPVKLNLAH